MDFFGRQEQAKRNTKWLVFYFVLAVLSIIAAIYLVLALVFLRDAPGLWNPGLFLGVAAGTLLVILIGSLTKTIQLSGGGGAVARTLGGRLLGTNLSDPDEIKLRNVVEEMSIASGVPVPEIYVLDNESGINAFAAGKTIDDAAVGVTRGCMKLLSRDELQGVIAHEFSHIFNGDMRLNLRLIGIVHGILCLAIIGRILLHTGTRRAYRFGARSRGKGGNPLPLIGLALLIIGSIGVLFGRLIKSAVSRQREFLADAAAVQFTRNPGGIAGALKKIGGLTYGSRLSDDHAEEASHMFFGNGLAPAWFGLMATHPPLKERIKAIDPSFDGSFPRVTAAPPVVSEPGGALRETGVARAKPVRPPMLDDLLGRPAAGSSAAPPIIRADSVVPDVGALRAQHLLFAEQLRASLSDSLLSAAHEPTGAVAVVFALLVSRDPRMRETQLQLLASHTESFIANQVVALLPEVDSLDERARLPLVDLCIPALRQFSPRQFTDFTGRLRQLIESDRQIDLFEYTLQKIVVRHLTPHFQERRKVVTQFYVLKPLVADCTAVLSALAQAGHQHEAEARSAFAQGAAQLARAADGVALNFCDASLEEVDAALDRLNQASPHLKKQILNACAHTVAADGVIQPNEAELLRAIADTLDCPLPPLVSAAT